MIPTKNRKEVSLDDQTIAILQIQAEKEGRNLKNFMEHILKQKANDFELTDAYKEMIDQKLEKHYAKKLNYISEEDFRKSTTRK